MSFEYKELAQDVVYDDYEDSVCKLDDKQIGYVKAKYGEHDGLARDAGDVFAKHDKKSESSEFEYEECRDPGCGESNELFDDAAVGTEHQDSVRDKSADDCKDPCDGVIEKKEQVEFPFDDGYVVLCRYKIIEQRKA